MVNWAKQRSAQGGLPTSGLHENRPVLLLFDCRSGIIIPGVAETCHICQRGRRERPLLKGQQEWLLQPSILQVNQRQLDTMSVLNHITRVSAMVVSGQEAFSVLLLFDCRSVINIPGVAETSQEDEEDVLGKDNRNGWISPSFLQANRRHSGTSAVIVARTKA